MPEEVVQSGIGRDLMRDLPIIVGGFFRSGTSLLRRLLDSHSRIHCGPEVKFFRDFYGDYTDDSLSHVRLFSTARTFGLPEAELLAVFGNAFIAFHERAAALAGKARWADKNPENVLYLQQWRSLLPEGFIFIHVVRHPLDALASLKEAGFPRAVPSDFSGKVLLYKKYYEAAGTYCQAAPDTSMTIVYENLVRQPTPILTSLFHFLGEPFEPNILEKFYLPERGVGIEDWKVGETQGIHRESIGRGAVCLSQEEIAIAQKLLDPIFWKF